MILDVIIGFTLLLFAYRSYRGGLQGEIYGAMGWLLTILLAGLLMPLGVLIMVLNIPVFVFGIRIMGRKYGLRIGKLSGGGRVLATMLGAHADVVPFQGPQIHDHAMTVARVPARKYYFDAELWQRAPERLLPRLSDWLGLSSPLSERYQTFSHTGKARKGDSSARIHSGRIDRMAADYSHIAIPEDALSRAQAVYRECRERMIKGAADFAAL